MEGDMVMAKRILCFGDSNTWGANPAENLRYAEDVRWTGVLQKELGESCRVIEEGQNGRTSVMDDPVEGRLSGLRYFAACYESQTPLDLVILMLGTNDLKARFNLEARTIAYGLKRYLDVLKVVPPAGRVPKVLLVSPIEISTDYRNHPLFFDMFGDGADLRSGRLAGAYREMAMETGIEWFDAAEHAKASPLDGVHMEPGEHRKLGIAMAKKVKQILG